MEYTKPNGEPFDPEIDLSMEMLDKIDFSHKPEKLKELDKVVQQAADARTMDATDPFKNLYILMYKGTGPIESVFFKSDRPQPVIIRDCQIWCAERSYRFINHKRAVVNLLASATREELSGRAEGDITDLITKQSRDASIKAV